MPHSPVATHEPKRIRAGDTTAWRRRVPGHPHTEGWSLLYIFVGPSKLEVTATPVDGHSDLYEVVLPASQTSQLQGGGYQWIARLSREVEGVVERYTVRDGTLKVDPDPHWLEDGRTFAERMVAIIKDSLMSMRTDGVVQQSINGRTVTFRGEEGSRQLERLLLFWEGRVKLERGGRVIGAAKVRFHAPV